jgi:RNA-splicing ligase RtcB
MGAHVAGGSRMSSHAHAGRYSDAANRTMLIEREQPQLVCKIVASESAESEHRLVKALKWLLEDSRRADNLEVA